MRHPRRHALRFVFDANVLDDHVIASIRLDVSECDDWRFVALEEIGEYLTVRVANRVRVGLAHPGVYLEDGDVLETRTP